MLRPARQTSAPGRRFTAWVSKTCTAHLSLAHLDVHLWRQPDRDTRSRSVWKEQVSGESRDSAVPLHMRVLLRC